MDIGAVIGIIIGSAIAIFIFVKKPHLIKAWLVLSWNFAITILAIIPGFGWLAHFIITKDKGLKEQIVKDGEQWDLETQKQWEAEKQERERQKEAAGNSTEVYREHYHDGWVDRENMKVSSDGERYYDPKDGQWHQIP